MNTYLNLKMKLIKLFAIVILFPFFVGVGVRVYAQTSEILLNSGWHLDESNVNGMSISLENFGGAYFYSPYLSNYFLHEYGNNCFESFKVSYTDLTETTFNLDTIIEYVSCNYTDPDEIAAVELYLSFYFELPLETNGSPKNPFAYSWADGGYPVEDLIITNSDGDWLLYRRAFLSIPTFNQNSFTIYPNPVKEVLQVNNSSNQPVSAIIYDIQGKKLQTHYLENNLSTIDVKGLKQGLYFVVFKSETGERVSKKFVKH